jgi:hypothetical protein
MFATETKREDAVASVVQALAEADAAIARAIDSLHAATATGSIESATGLPTELFLMLGCRRTRAEARALIEASGTLGSMPALARRFASGSLSWPELRAIGQAVRAVPRDARGHIDALVATSDAEPEELLGRVEDAVGRARPDLFLAREDRAHAGSALHLQPRLDGYGGSIRGEADAAGFAIICAAVEAGARQPAPEVDRAQARMDALVGLCQVSLDAAGGSRRARTRLLATVELSELASEAGASARALLGAVGARGRLSPVATAAEACSAEVVPVIFSGAQPIGVGSAIGAVSGKLRTALVARDLGCRFPGCRMPAAFSDAHHITARSLGATPELGGLVLLCRRCHRRVHRHRWRITPEPDGSITFTHHGQRYTSASRRE